MWQEKDDALYKKFEFKDFVEAFDFMKKVATIAEEVDHHPRWENVYNVVEVWLNTHSARDKITAKDHRLAGRIDDLLVAPKAVAGLKEAKLFADGGSRGNPGPSASGFVILDLKDQIVVQEGLYLGVATNNQAEYTAVKIGLEKAREMGLTSLQVFLDSQLVVNQVNGLYKVKHRDLKPLYEAVKKLEKAFESISFTHVPREENTLADTEVNKVLDTESNLELA